MVTTSPMIITPLVAPIAKVDNITPFTYRDGETYLSILYRLREYITTVLVPEMDAIAADLIAKVDAAIEQNELWTLEQINTLTAYVDEQVAQIIGDSVEVQDPVMSGIVNDSDSLTRTALDGLYADKATQETVNTGRLSDANLTTKIDTAIAEQYTDITKPYIDDAITGTVTAYQSADAAVTQAFNKRDSVRTSFIQGKGTNLAGVPYAYEVMRIHTNGQFIPGLLGKEFANDYQNQGTTGAAFIPPRVPIDQFYKQKGGGVVANASGWRLTGNIGEMRGAQIRNGIIYHDLSGANYQDCSAIGIRADGRLKAYSTLKGDTAASMVADGVVNSWSWGPAVVDDGEVMPLTDPIWAGAIADGPSARQILGQSQTGDILLITVHGVTGSTGLTITEVGQFAYDLGCYVALVLDGGGSAQTLINGSYSHQSSDVSGFRDVADVIVFNTHVDSAMTTDWLDITLNAGYVKTGSYFRSKLVNGVVHLDGLVQPASGNFGTASVTVGVIAPAHRHYGNTSKQFKCVGNGDGERKVTVDRNGNVQIVGNTLTTPQYICVDQISYVQR